MILQEEGIPLEEYVRLPDQHTDNSKATENSLQSAGSIQYYRHRTSGERAMRKSFFCNMPAPELNSLMQRRLNCSKQTQCALIRLYHFRVTPITRFRCQCDVLFEAWSMTFEEEIVRRARDLQHWSFEELFNTLLECLETLRVLHAHGYVHGNLTPRHIVCDELGSLKIADQFCASEDFCVTGSELVALANIAQKSSVPSNMQYLASPYAMRNLQERLCSESDIYALALCLLEAATLNKSTSLYDYRNGLIIHAILNSRLNIVRERYNATLTNVITRMCDSGQRLLLTVENILQVLYNQHSQMTPYLLLPRASDAFAVVYEHESEASVTQNSLKPQILLNKKDEARYENNANSVAQTMHADEFSQRNQFLSQNSSQSTLSAIGQLQTLEQKLSSLESRMFYSHSTKNKQSEKIFLTRELAKPTASLKNSPAKNTVQEKQAVHSLQKYANETRSQTHLSENIILKSEIVTQGDICDLSEFLKLREEVTSVELQQKDIKNLPFNAFSFRKQEECRSVEPPKFLSLLKTLNSEYMTDIKEDFQQEKQPQNEELSYHDIREQQKKQFGSRARGISVQCEQSSQAKKIGAVAVRAQRCVSVQQPQNSGTRKWQKYAQLSDMLDRCIANTRTMIQTTQQKLQTCQPQIVLLENRQAQPQNQAALSRAIAASGTNPSFFINNFEKTVQSPVKSSDRCDEQELSNRKQIQTLRKILAPSNDEVTQESCVKLYSNHAASKQLSNYLQKQLTVNNNGNNISKYAVPEPLKDSKENTCTTLISTEQSVVLCSNWCQPMRNMQTHSRKKQNFAKRV